MAITRDDLENYGNMKKYLFALDEEIATAYNTYKSPSTFSSGASHSADPGDPVNRALKRIEMLKGKRTSIVNRMIEIEGFVEDIDDWFERAICRYRYLAGYKWEDVCFRLCKHRSYSGIMAYNREWWRCREESENLQ